MDDHVAAASALDHELVAVARSIKVLSTLAWPAAVGDAFLASWSAGAPQLPAVTPARADHHGAVEALDTIAARCDRAHPAGAYVHRTARSYRDAVGMLDASGTAEFTRLSRRLYGDADEVIAPGVTNRDAAAHFIHATDDLARVCLVRDDDYRVAAEDVAAHIRERVDGFFTDDRVEVSLDSGLAAKAAAGATRIRIRAGASFTPLDLEQLVEHEAFVHTATLLNGRRQRVLPSLGLGAPRTTWAQEGLATFAELATGAIDLNRLRRVALRVQAVDVALDGADFLDVFRWFLDHGQDERESYQSAARIFRGGDPRGGGVVFTKDAAYLKGLVATHAFLRAAIERGLPQHLRLLFAGRLTLGDVVDLADLYEQGVITEARYRPKWVADQRQLAAYLTYSAFADRIRLDQVDLDGFLASEAEREAAD